MKKTKPVEDIQQYWMESPPEISDRCKEWIELINNGWRPNRRVGKMGYYSASTFYGIYIWEYCNIIYQMLYEMEKKGT